MTAAFQLLIYQPKTTRTPYCVDGGFESKLNCYYVNFRIPEFSKGCQRH